MNKELKSFIQNKELDLTKLIKMLPKLRKINNTIVAAKIEMVITENIIIQSKQIRELKDLIKKDG